MDRCVRCIAQRRRVLLKRVRVVLFILLLNGLVPSLAEVVELFGHFVGTGHVAHFQVGESDLPELGDDEHGCGPTSHHCGCCVSQSILLREVVAALPQRHAFTGESFAHPRSPRGAPLSRVERPPIQAA